MEVWVIRAIQASAVLSPFARHTPDSATRAAAWMRTPAASRSISAVTSTSRARSDAATSAASNPDANARKRSTTSSTTPVAGMAQVSAGGGTGLAEKQRSHRRKLGNYFEQTT